MGQRVPFVVDVCPMTFEQLDLLLRQVSEGMDGSSDWPPAQEKECMIVATLNLLRLQVGKIVYLNALCVSTCTIEQTPQVNGNLILLFFFIFFFSSMQPSVIK